MNNNGFAEFEGKHRMRKHMTRKCIDSSSPFIRHILQRKFGISNAKMNPHSIFKRYLLPPNCYMDNSSTSMCTKFCRTSINKQRCPVYVITWTPEGRRMITGNSAGEFTLWNGTAFNFETILQAHEDAVRAMTWSHNENWMVTADHGGVIKFWQPSMTNVQLLQGHREPIRSLSFSPTDFKFISCSDDATIKIWDFESAREESVLTGHGWDVKCAEYHPQKGIIASGSKDNLVKLWDPKSGTSLYTIHSHKNTVMKVAWNRNGNWLLSASRDQLIKLYDIRTMKEFATLKGHTREVTSVAWHPVHENMFASGGFDGALLYWNVGEDAPVVSIPFAHENSIWDIQWHPVGHIVATASNDHTTKFWCRNRPGDAMGDKYNSGLNMEYDIGITAAHGMQTGGAVKLNLPGMSEGPTRNIAEPRPIQEVPTRKPPPEQYTCNRCSTKGHWLEDCPNKDKPGGPPPANYVCKRCMVPGHYISACPMGNIPPDNYTCHRCKQKGHWKQDCPLDSNPALEHARQLKAAIGPAPMELSTGSAMGTFQTEQSNNGGHGRPPDNYTCHRCKQKGHWKQHCPNAQVRGGNDNSGLPPPDNYSCHRCNQKGHWIQDCPTDPKNANPRGQLNRNPGGLLGAPPPLGGLLGGPPPRQNKRKLDDSYDSRRR